MTTRVFDCQRRPLASVTSRPEPREPGAPVRGFPVAAGTALVLAPVAGAAEAPLGWIACILVSGLVLSLVPLVGRRMPWGWAALTCALVPLAAPRGEFGFLGPACLVATALCGVLWLANRGSRRRALEERPRAGTRERAAQQLLGTSGERYVGQVLAHELPDSFVLINGLKLPRGAGDIDHLVVGPTGVFLLETKTMAGRIECDSDGNWRRTRIGRRGAAYPAYIGNPATQVQRNIFAARTCLRTRVPRLFQGTSLWLEGLVVFPHPRTELVTDHSRVPAVRLNEATARICTHTPRRGLKPSEVDEVVDALLVEGRERGQQVVAQGQRAQALAEAALALPIALAMLFGIVATSRLVQAQSAVVAVAQEAARAGALAPGPAEAAERMRRRVDLVAPGLGLDPRAVVLEWDVSSFTRDRGRVVAVIRYAVDFRDLPLANSVPSPTVRAEHVEWVDPFRGGIPVADSP